MWRFGTSASCSVASLYGPIGEGRAVGATGAAYSRLMVISVALQTTVVMPPRKEKILMRTESYSVEFFAKQRAGSYSSARAILPIVFDLISPASIVDLGCGVATWLAAAKELGVRDILGVDGDYISRNQLSIAQECFMAADLT